MSDNNNNTNGQKKKMVLNRLAPSEVRLEIKDPVDPKALEQATAIMNELGPEGEAIAQDKLLEVAKRLGDLNEDETSVTVSKEECLAAYESLTETERDALNNIHARVVAFAKAQRQSIQDIEIDFPGGKAGHTVSPCRAAGCYAPGGRYPLPSSVLMTAVTAKMAGCETVVLSSPKPAPITKAAAHVCGVDVFLRVGGAQAIACMARGVQNVPSLDGSGGCDVIVGPGNKWVTAAKSIVSGRCGIDMLAGPSEVLVIADRTANPEVVAADLIAQAEHDVVARAILLSTDEGVIDSVNDHVGRQIDRLPEPNRGTAAAALGQSFAVLCSSIDEAIQLSDDIAPEHLEIQTEKAMEVGMRCGNYGGLFVGEHAAEVLGDYGAGRKYRMINNNMRLVIHFMQEIFLTS